MTARDADEGYSNVLLRIRLRFWDFEGGFQVLRGITRL